MVRLAFFREGWGRDGRMCEIVLALAVTLAVVAVLVLSQGALFTGLALAAASLVVGPAVLSTRR